MLLFSSLSDENGRSKSGNYYTMDCWKTACFGGGADLYLVQTLIWWDLLQLGNKTRMIFSLNIHNHPTGGLLGVLSNSPVAICSYVPFNHPCAGEFWDGCSFLLGKLFICMAIHSGLLKDGPHQNGIFSQTNFCSLGLMELIAVCMGCFW